MTPLVVQSLATKSRNVLFSVIKAVAIQSWREEEFSTHPSGFMSHHFLQVNALPLHSLKTIPTPHELDHEDDHWCTHPTLSSNLNLGCSPPHLSPCPAFVFFFFLMGYIFEGCPSGMAPLHDWLLVGGRSFTLIGWWGEGTFKDLVSLLGLSRVWVKGPVLRGMVRGQGP